MSTTYPPQNKHCLRSAPFALLRSHSKELGLRSCSYSIIIIRFRFAPSDYDYRVRWASRSLALPSRPSTQRTDAQDEKVFMNTDYSKYKERRGRWKFFRVNGEPLRLATRFTAEARWLQSIARPCGASEARASIIKRLSNQSASPCLWRCGGAALGACHHAQIPKKTVSRRASRQSARVAVLFYAP
jgi:hypothetical protein